MGVKTLGEIRQFGLVRLEVCARLAKTEEKNQNIISNASKRGEMQGEGQGQHLCTVTGSISKTQMVVN